MGLQLNPVAAALLVAIIGITAFFVFHEGEATESSITEEESEFTGRPLPTIFYKNHTTPLGDDAKRFGREIDSDAAAANITAPAQLIVHRVNATPSPAPRFIPQTSSSSTSSRRSRSSGGGGNDNNEPAPVVETSTNTTNTTPTNSTPPANNTPTNVTNSTIPPINITVPINNTNITVPKPPTNTTNQTTNPPTNNTNSTPVQPPANNTNSTPPAPPLSPLLVTLTVEQGFPQDQNVVFQCKADGVTKFEWDFHHGGDKNSDGTVYHTFPESGTYTVECTAKKGKQETTATTTVTVEAPRKVDDDYPYAAMVSSSGTGSARTFICEDVGYTATDFLWRFDGGQYNSSIAGVNYFEGSTKTITHTFPGAGNYDVSCEATSFEDRMSRAYWEEGRVCNSADGCVSASATTEIEIEGASNDDEEEPLPPPTNSTNSTNSTINVLSEDEEDKE